MIVWPRETATLLKSNLHYYHREKSTFEKFDAGLKLRIVFYTQKIKYNQKPKKQFSCHIHFKFSVFSLQILFLFLPELMFVMECENVLGKSGCKSDT